MKVIVSTEAIKFPLTGIGRYSYELVKHLAEFSDVESLRYFNGKAVVASLSAEVASTNDQFGLKGSLKHKLKHWVQSNHFASELYRQALPMMQKKALKGYENYLYHGTNFYVPAFSGKKVATFHDLSPFTYSECHIPARAKYMQKELLKTLDQADALITDSEFVRQEIIDTFGWAGEKVHCVPLAAGKEFYPRDRLDLEPVLAKYDLGFKAYSLFVGTIEPRKNILRLLDAYSKLPLELRKVKPLVLAGFYGWNSEQIHVRIDKASSEGWVKYLGFTPAEDLPYLFAGADLFIYPSLYEGFGLPPLEAMQSGVPVVCSNSSSLPEVVGSAALTCEPDDVDGLSAHIQCGLEDHAWRKMAIEQGLKQSQQFSWTKCAQNTLAVYQAVLSEQG
jgi:alpha-1,3-rhamnosyl/mannosyltransferase